MKIDTVCTLFGLSACAMAVSTNNNFGSNVYACISMDTEPTDPFIVDWKIGATGDQCMKDKGKAGEMKVSEQGITCRDLGWVSINDDFFSCGWYESWWTLAYTTRKASYSGTAQSRWKYWGSLKTVMLGKRSPGTQLCGSKALCPTDKIEWSGTSKGLYFIFEPLKIASQVSNHNETADSEL
ncbi:unnamed protein product [Clonostachys byssicola]|uniref:Uncharacterized protein n=1 Tax=Clonostachys byssicola TaxID=160290 RepID=A0A9N9UCB8_9HYPO|nr:unnamed protein product [Clonostachys byssicola]